MGLSGSKPPLRYRGKVGQRAQVFRPNMEAAVVPSYAALTAGASYAVTGPSGWVQISDAAQQSDPMGYLCTSLVAFGDSTIRGGVLRLLIELGIGPAGGEQLLGSRYWSTSGDPSTNNGVAWAWPPAYFMPPVFIPTNTRIAFRATIAATATTFQLTAGVTLVPLSNVEPF